MSDQQPKERPILFSLPMLRMILAGRKTMTRRVVHPQPVFSPQRNGKPDVMCYPTCPYGKPGDLLWVRHEHWRNEFHHVWDSVTKMLRSFKRSDEKPDTLKIRSSKLRVLDRMLFDEKPFGDVLHKLPGMFLPRWAALLELVITGVRVERLQDISEQDAIAEGFLSDNFSRTDYPPVAAFRDYWETLNAKRDAGWDANPYVWVVEFAIHRNLAEAKP